VLSMIIQTENSPDTRSGVSKSKHSWPYRLGTTLIICGMAFGCATGGARSNPPSFLVGSDPDSVRTLGREVPSYTADHSVKPRTAEESKLEEGETNLRAFDHPYSEMPSVGQVAKGWIIFVGIAFAILGVLWWLR
jgi:hypothetical protein